MIIILPLIELANLSLLFALHICHESGAPLLLETLICEASLLGESTCQIWMDSQNSLLHCQMQIGPFIVDLIKLECSARTILRSAGVTCINLFEFTQ